MKKQTHFHPYCPAGYGRISFVKSKIAQSCKFQGVLFPLVNPNTQSCNSFTNSEPTSKTWNFTDLFQNLKSSHVAVFIGISQCTPETGTTNLWFESDVLATGSCIWILAFQLMMVFGKVVEPSFILSASKGVDAMWSAASGSCNRIFSALRVVSCNKPLLH